MDFIEMCERQRLGMPNNCVICQETNEKEYKICQAQKSRR